MLLGLVVEGAERAAALIVMPAEVAEAVKPDVAAAMQVGALMLRDLARVYMGERTITRTGTGIRSIDVKPLVEVEDSMEVAMGPGPAGYYVAYLDRGTRWIRARRMLQDAAIDEGPRAVAETARLINAAIRRETERRVA